LTTRNCRAMYCITQPVIKASQLLAPCSTKPDKKLKKARRGVTSKKHKVRMFVKATKKRRDNMKKTLVTLVTTLALVMVMATVVFAADTKTVPIKATIPSQSTLNVTVSKVVGTVMTAATEVNFGSLILDPTFNIFKTSDDSYYAVDIGVNSNATAWTVTHAVSSMINGTATLNNNINVTFMNQQTSTTAVQLAKLSYSLSNAKVINKADITAGGWLRIYYGLATGSGDATGVVVIPATAVAGAYAGTITLTLAP
jgi:hypothetical protein